MKKVIYLDNAATTKLDPLVLQAMMPYLTDNFFNPAAKYELGYDCNNAVEESKGIIANSIGAAPAEIYFTSGGTESDNWALHYVRPGGHLITTAIEHHAILRTCEELEKQGIDVTYIKPDKYGHIDPDDIKAEIRNNTQLISVMAANNEIGSIQDLEQIGKIASSYNILFHTDAVQAYGHIPINVNTMGIDMLSSSAHKINGPKGMGFLYVSKRVPLKPFIYGGDQQAGMRSGTENVPGIVGYGMAAKLAHDNMEERAEYVIALREHLIDRIFWEIEDVQLNGEPVKRLPNNINITFKRIRGEQALALLDANHICVSTGSACNSSSGEPSHVLTAIGLSEEDANASLRFTLSHENTMEEMDKTVDILKTVIEQLRR